MLIKTYQRAIIEAPPRRDALEILGIASRPANASVGDSRNGYLRLERWAVEAALLFEQIASGEPLL